MFKSFKFKTHEFSFDKECTCIIHPSIIWVPESLTVEQDILLVLVHRQRYHTPYKTLYTNESIQEIVIPPQKNLC